MAEKEDRRDYQVLPLDMTGVSHDNITLNGLHLATTTRHLVNCTKIDCLAIIMSNFLHFQLLEMERTSQKFNKN